jgi:5'-3' exonuclease
MFIFIDYQVDSLFLEENVPKGVSSVVSTSPPKWLNIVLDINGILCHCMEKAATRGMLFVNDVKQGIHSPTVPTIVRPKAVLTRPGLHEF